MADIELVIKIPRKVYKAICDKNALGCDIGDIKNMIRNGTPLPKGHGRIGDLDRLYNVFDKNVVSADAFKELFDYAPTIIEAESEEHHD